MWAGDNVVVVTATRRETKRKMVKGTSTSSNLISQQGMRFEEFTYTFFKNEKSMVFCNSRFSLYMLAYMVGLP